MNPKSKTPERNAKIVAARLAGTSVKDLASAFGLSEGRIGGIIWENDVRVVGRQDSPKSKSAAAKHNDVFGSRSEIRRKRKGIGFAYFDPAGTYVGDIGEEYNRIHEPANILTRGGRAIGVVVNNDPYHPHSFRISFNGAAVSGIVFGEDRDAEYSF